MTINKEQQVFIERVLPGAKAAQTKMGVLVSLTLAQAILESGWGRASIGNNIFGIKATSSWKGKTQFVSTTEYEAGKKVSIKASFRDYGTIDESIADHAKLLTMPRYKAVIAAKDYKEACVQIQKCGYATDPKYAVKLISLIETLKLNQWDRGVTAQVIKPVIKPTVRTYQVKRGDTLGAIAKANGTTVAALVKLNGIRDADLISVGLVIRVY